MIRRGISGFGGLWKIGGDRAIAEGVTWPRIRGGILGEKRAKDLPWAMEQLEKGRLKKRVCFFVCFFCEPRFSLQAESFRDLTL